MKESDIRPDHLMDGVKEAADRDLKRLIDRQGEFIEVSCPACGATGHVSAFDKNSISYVSCTSCETLYVNPRPTPEILEDFYANSENYAYWNKYVFPASEDSRRQRIFRPRVQKVMEFCRRYGVRQGNLMEVGAGFGIFCEEIRKEGLFDKIIAVEPTPGLAETCRGRGLEVLEMPIEKVEIEGDLSSIVSFEVIEHLFDPKAFIVKCHKLLSQGGMLITTCPSAKGFDVIELREHSVTVDHEHLNYFTPRSLALLLESCGFEVLEVLTPGLLDAEIVRKQALAGNYPLADRPFLKTVLVDEWERLGDRFQAFLAESLMSSHLWAVAMKR